MAREAFVMNGRTAARVRQLAQSQTPANVNGVDTSSGRQVVWVTVTGEAVSGEGAGLDGWYPCRVEIGADGDAFVENGYSLCKHHKGEPLAVGYRYAGLRQKPKDGESRFLVTGRTAYTSADDGGDSLTWRRDGFGILVQFDETTPQTAFGGSSARVIDLPNSALTVPAAGWYDVDFRLNLAASALSPSGTPPSSFYFVISCRLFRIKDDGERGQQLIPWPGASGSVCGMGGSFPSVNTGAIGSYSLRGTFYFPDDERGLRAMIQFDGPAFSSASGTTFSDCLVKGSGSIHAEWAGPRIDPPEPPPAPVDGDGEAIADGYSPNPEEVYQWTLDGTASYPPPGETITGYSWSVLTPDSSTVTGSGATWTQEWDSWGEGLHVATLTVAFSGGGSDTDTHEFTIPYVPPEPAGLTVFVFGDDGDGVYEPLTEGGTYMGRYVWIQGIDVEDGLLAPTDEDGYVCAEDLTPGTYSVSIWPASLNPGEYVSTSPHPVTVVLTSGVTPEVQIGIATLGSGGGGGGPEPL